ncbi:MAG: hypothetical protein MMC23_004668 [Stictis urceolatum]|nr:hypothetical protein [Stictis urceolata]
MPSFSVVLVSTFALAATFVSAALAANAGLEKRFTPGFCVVCVTQYQKNENGVGAEYEYDIQLTDGAALDIGGVNRQPIPDGGFFDLESQAPDVLVIQSGGIDNNPIGFRYNGDSSVVAFRDHVYRANHHE